MNKTVSRLLAAVGVLLVMAGLVLAFVIVPSMKVFPDDVDVVRHYKVEYLTLLNGETLEFYIAAPGENPNLRIDRHVVVEAVDGNKTLVREDQILYDGDQALLTLSKAHALDRKTMEFLKDPPEEWTQQPGYWQREGLTIGWGIGAEEKDYVGWSDDYRQPITLKYEREEEHGGIKTYYFTAAGEPAPIDPAQVEFLTLPTEISISSLAALASSIESEEVDLNLQQRIVLIGLIQAAVEATQDIPEGAEVTIPLHYLYDWKGEYWVEPTTGVLIDTRKYEHRAATFPDEIFAYFKAEAAKKDENAPDYIPPDTLEKLLPITVSEFVYQATPESVADARKDAEDARTTLNLFGLYIPIALVVIGFVMLVVGVFGMRMPASTAA